MGKKSHKIEIDKSEFSDAERKRFLSALYVTPSWSASLAISRINPQSDFSDLSSLLREMNAHIFDGDLSRAEAMLIDQAHVLQAIFSDFTIRMAKAEYLSQMETYSKVALRAQNQCQRTLKTLLEYKNPKRATFIKQQNNAVNQQINQGEQPKEIPKKEINPANKILEQKDGQWLDTGKEKETVPVNSQMETVAERHRAED
jgi:hypothetical protein